jgi:hypothetical protein
MSPTSRFLLLLASLLAAGCVSVDRRSWSEQVDRLATESLSGAFVARAVYRSKGEFLASENLALALGIASSDADTVLISFNKQDGLLLQFLREANARLSRSFTPAQGVRLTEDGRIEVPLQADCGGRDSPGFGCYTKRITLHINSRGELVCVESGGAAGVLGVAPFALYAKLVSIYTPATGDRTIDNVPTIY